MATARRNPAIGEENLAFAFASGDARRLDPHARRMQSHVVCGRRGSRALFADPQRPLRLHWVDPFGGDDEEQVGEDRIVAPLPGTVVALLAEEGAPLEKGAPILTLEVMKMEQTLRAPYAGILKKIKCKVGDIVQEGVELAEIEPAA